MTAYVMRISDWSSDWCSSDLLSFAFGWTPCIGPVLGAILTVSAVSPTVSSGIALLGIYSLGLGLPFLGAALFADGLTSRLKAMRRAGAALHASAGVVRVLMGVALNRGRLSGPPYWLLAPLQHGKA